MDSIKLIDFSLAVAARSQANANNKNIVRTRIIVQWQNNSNSNQNCFVDRIAEYIQYYTVSPILEFCGYSIFCVCESY